MVQPPLRGGPRGQNQHVRSAAAHGRGDRMRVVSSTIGTAELVPLPDLVIHAATHRLCSRTATRLAAHDAADDAAFADEMMLRPIAEPTDDGSTQHCEVPPSFFAQVLGPNRK